MFDLKWETIHRMGYCFLTLFSYIDIETKSTQIKTLCTPLTIFATIFFLVNFRFYHNIISDKPNDPGSNLKHILCLLKKKTESRLILLGCVKSNTSSGVTEKKDVRVIRFNVIKAHRNIPCLNANRGMVREG